MINLDKKFDFCTLFNSDFFEKFFDSMDAFVISLDQSKNILYFNHKTKEFFPDENELRFFINQNWNNLSENKILGFKISGRSFIVKWKIHEVSQPDGSTISFIVGDNQTELDYLKEQNFILNFILTKVPGYVFWKDSDLKLIGCNENFARQIGLKSPTDVIGKTDFELPWEESQTEGFIRDDREILETGQSKINIIETQRQKDGTQLTLLTSKVPTFDRSGNITGVLGIYMDITELDIAKQKAEMANRAKTNFLAVISHELRTPINGIYGMAQILHEKLENEVLIDCVSNIEKSSQHLLSLVNDILDLSSMETGKISVRKKPFNLDEISKSSLSEVKFKLREKQIRLLYQSDPDVPHWIMGDSVRLKQVILNLLGNAIKFTEQGMIKILVSCLEKNEQSVRLKIGVRDTGIGIPPVMQQKIFERFVQMESEYNRPYEGVGLGLAICKQIIEAMGGTIHVESEEGEGSFFWMNIPFEIANEQQIKQLVAEAVTRTPIRSQFDATILVVEDNVLNQKVAKNMLESLGCFVDIVDCGVDALKMVEEHEYDLVFMDVGLPNMDGLTVTEHLRRDKANADLPIIGLTAHALEADIKRCYQASMNDVVTKPITLENLKRVLSKWITN